MNTDCQENNFVDNAGTTVQLSTAEIELTKLLHVVHLVMCTLIHRVQSAL